MSKTLEEKLPENRDKYWNVINKGEEHHQECSSKEIWKVFTFRCTSTIFDQSCTLSAFRIVQTGTVPEVLKLEKSELAYYTLLYADHIKIKF